MYFKFYYSKVQVPMKWSTYIQQLLIHTSLTAAGLGLGLHRTARGLKTHGLWKEDHSLPCGKDSMLLADEAKHQFVTWVKICLFSDQTLDWSLFTKSWLCSGKRKGLNLLQGVAPLTALDCLTFISVMSQYKTPSSAEDPNCLMWDTSEGQRLLSRLEALCTLRTQPNWIPHGPWTPQTHCVNGGRKRCSFRLIHDSVCHSQTEIWQNKAHILFNLC